MLRLGLMIGCHHLYIARVGRSNSKPSNQQASGQTTYHDDNPVAGQLYAAFVPCTRALAKVESIGHRRRLGVSH
eukprot:COSAG04_NODE_14237_length_576_cov_0.792453_1_plen_74_part_00